MAPRAALISGLLIAFLMTVLILARFMPPPLRPTDYLVIGTAATFVCLLVVLVSWMANEKFHDGKRR